ncbi:hypothetical protein BCV70DRAFT_217329 [Testicularia cyperi]|uniref:Myb-like domain-containing protein n=1 Tax=Testicularia cyperi TaxID=1882483 RepID=A0A317XQG4_9BASI|nr:hypothetical protein BCV70DRAFT_217329 [Testicularia cyperi]
MVEDRAAKAAKEQPWSNKERLVMVQAYFQKTQLDDTAHKAMCGALDALDSPHRDPQAIRRQWNRKIVKDILAIYNSGSASASTSTSTLSPKKRQRLDDAS